MKSIGGENENGSDKAYCMTHKGPDRVIKWSGNAEECGLIIDKRGKKRVPMMKGVVKIRSDNIEAYRVKNEKTGVGMFEGIR